jgi:SCP-2 sterol transfer family
MLIELGRWGGNYMGARKREVFFPSGHISAIRATFRGHEARGVHATYQFRIDGESFHAEIDDGSVAAALGESESLDLVVATDTGTSIELLQRRLAPLAAVRSGAVAISGSVSEFERCIDLLAWVPRDGEAGSQPAGGATGLIRPPPPPAYTSSWFWAWAICCSVCQRSACDSPRSMRSSSACASSSCSWAR